MERDSRLDLKYAGRRKIMDYRSNKTGMEKRIKWKSFNSEYGRENYRKLNN